MEATNLISEIKGLDKEIKSYGITEIFVFDGELYTTSEYDLPEELLEQLSNQIFI